MIPILVFYLHVVATVYVFTKRWQEENRTEAFVAVAFMALVFFAGWSVSTFILKLLIGQEGLGKFFERDALSLILLTMLEVALYSLYFTRGGRQKES